MNYDAFLSRAAEGMRESAIRKMGIVGARVPDLISFAPGYPDPATFPWGAISDIAQSLLTGADGTVLQYGMTRGYRPLLESLERVLEPRGIRSRFEQRLISSGSQQGLDLVAKILIDPGDVVLVELPTYTGAISAFKNARASLIGVRQERDGIDTDALDETLLRLRAAGRRVRLLYLVPNFQNPTGLLIGLAKRRRLLEWAEARDVLIIEDDPYGDLYFPDTTTVEETRPLKADDVSGRVVYLSSFSKTLAPGFRTAWVVGPEPIVAKFDVAKQATDLCTGGLDQRIVHQAIVQDVLAGQGPRLREVYQQKRSAMQDALARELGDIVRCEVPRGGFFLWATLPRHIDTERLLARAIEARVTYVAGGAFFVDGSGSNTIRLSFSHPALARLEEGVRRLATAIRAEVGNYSRPETTDSGISPPSG